MSDDNTWRTPVRGDCGEHGVVIRMGKPESPYWWVICPVTATLIFDAEWDDLRGCRDASSCIWDEVHDDIAAVITAVQP